MILTYKKPNHSFYRLKERFQVPFRSAVSIITSIKEAINIIKIETKKKKKRDANRLQSTNEVHTKLLIGTQLK